MTWLSSIVKVTSTTGKRLDNEAMVDRKLPTGAGGYPRHREVIDVYDWFT
jgi:hypothetical protein